MAADRLDVLVSRGNLRSAFERVHENCGCREDESTPRPKLPPPLTLRRYLELKHAVVTLPPEWRR